MSIFLYYNICDIYFVIKGYNVYNMITLYEHLSCDEKQMHAITKRNVKSTVCSYCFNL